MCHAARRNTLQITWNARSRDRFRSAKSLVCERGSDVSQGDVLSASRELRLKQSFPFWRHLDSAVCVNATKYRITSDIIFILNAHQNHKTCRYNWTPKRDVLFATLHPVSEQLNMSSSTDCGGGATRVHSSCKFLYTLLRLTLLYLLLIWIVCSSCGKFTYMHCL